MTTTPRTPTPLAGQQGGSQPLARRWGVVGSVAVDNSAITASDPIDIREFREIAVLTPSGINTLTVYASDSLAGTYVVVDTIGTNGAVTVAASKWSTLDTTKIGPYGFIKFLGNAAGAVTVCGKT